MLHAHEYALGRSISGLLNPCERDYIQTWRPLPLERSPVSLCSRVLSNIGAETVVKRRLEGAHALENVVLRTRECVAEVNLTDHSMKTSTMQPPNFGTTAGGQALESQAYAQDGNKVIALEFPDVLDQANVGIIRRRPRPRPTDYSIVML